MLLDVLSHEFERQHTHVDVAGLAGRRATWCSVDWYVLEVSYPPRDLLWWRARSCHQVTEVGLRRQQESGRTLLFLGKRHDRSNGILVAALTPTHDFDFQISSSLELLGSGKCQQSTIIAEILPAGSNGRHNYF